jgi:two-component sensor histidine kinase
MSFWTRDLIGSHLFGAISVKTGRVSVRWSFKQNRRAKSWLRIQWQERGGPQVSPPTRAGFGTSVVRELVPYELGGSVEPEYRSDGFRCRLKIPARWLAGMCPSVRREEDHDQ